MQDGVMVEPGKRWEFNDEVTAVFDDMLKRSIPQYEVIRDLVYKVGSEYVKPGTTIVDIGCSRGEAVRPFVVNFGERNDYLLMDVSEPMLAACRE